MVFSEQWCKNPDILIFLNLKSIVWIFVLLFMAMPFSLVFAQGALIVPDISSYQGVQNPGNVGSVELGLSSLVVGIILNIRYLIGALAIAGIVFAGVKLFIAQGSSEEAWTKTKPVLVYSIIGLGLVGLAGELTRIFAVGNCAELGMLPGYNNVGCVSGGFLKDPNTIIQRSTLFNTSVQYLITFIKYTLGSVAVVSIMLAAAKMATNAAGDELTKSKKSIVAAIIGLIIIILADPLINNVLFDIDKTRYPGVGGAEVGINVGQGIKEIVGFTNYLVSILGPIAILVLIVGGIMYITSAAQAENQEKAKKMILAAIVGLIIIYGAFAIVTTFLSGRLSVQQVGNIGSITYIEHNRT